MSPSHMTKNKGNEGVDQFFFFFFDTCTAPLLVQYSLHGALLDEQPCTDEQPHSRMRRGAPPMTGRPRRPRRVDHIAILVTLAALAAVGVSGASEPSTTSSTSFQQKVRPGSSCGALRASGIGVHATEKPAGNGQRAAADAAEADGPAACRVEFSLRVPAVNPAVTFTGEVLRDMFSL